jgi:hypothetical protein
VLVYSVIRLPDKHYSSEMKIGPDLAQRGLMGYGRDRLFVKKKRPRGGGANGEGSPLGTRAANLSRKSLRRPVVNLNAD